MGGQKRVTEQRALMVWTVQQSLQAKRGTGQNVRVCEVIEDGEVQKSVCLVIASGATSLHTKQRQLQLNVALLTRSSPPG
jgi:hypothetical protein